MLNAILMTVMLTTSNANASQNVIANVNQYQVNNVYNISKKIFMQTYKPKDCKFQTLYVFLVNKNTLYDVASFDKKYNGYYGAYMPKRKTAYVLDNIFETNNTEYLAHEFGHYFADSCNLDSEDINIEHGMLFKYQIKYLEAVKEK